MLNIVCIPIVHRYYCFKSLKFFLNITRIFRQLAQGKIKLVLGPWLLSLILLSSDMQSVIVSSLSTPEFAVAPKNFEELVGSRFSIALFANDTGASKIIRTLSAEEGKESFFGKLETKIESAWTFADIFVKVRFLIFKSH